MNNETFWTREMVIEYGDSDLDYDEFVASKARVISDEEQKADEIVLPFLKSVTGWNIWYFDWANKWEKYKRNTLFKNELSKLK